MPRAAVKVITTRDKMIRQTTFNHEFDANLSLPIPGWTKFQPLDPDDYNDDDTSFDPYDPQWYK